MLSTGPVWLFIVFGVVVALLPDILIGVWEAYSAGEGVLVNQVKLIVFRLLSFRFPPFRVSCCVVFPTGLLRLIFTTRKEKEEKTKA